MQEPTQATNLTKQQPQRQTINTFKSLMKVKPPTDQNYSVLAYFLVDNPKDVHGMFLPLGNYKTPEEATARANFIITSTGHRQVFATKMGQWQELDTTFRPDRTSFVPDNLSEKLSRQHELEKQKDAKQVEEQENLQQEILKEREDELKPETLDYYKHQCLMAIRNRAAIDYHEKQLQQLRQGLDERKEKVKSAFSMKPEFEEQWLDVLEKRLIQRGEKDLFSSVKEAWSLLKTDILNP